MGKIHFISYANNEFSPRRDKLIRACGDVDWFDSCSIYSDLNLSSGFKKQYKDILEYNTAGCWLWKSEILCNKLQEIDDGDIIIYADAGCTLNLIPDSKKTFDRYIDICNNHDMLRFELEHPEWKYTNTKTFKFFKDKYQLKKEHVMSNQLVGGILGIKKTQTVIDFFNLFFDIIEKQKGKMKIMLGNFAIAISDKSKYLYQPV